MDSYMWTTVALNYSLNSKLIPMEPYAIWLMLWHPLYGCFVIHSPLAESSNTTPSTTTTRGGEKPSATTRDMGAFDGD